MRKYLAATLLIAAAVGPASALDVRVGAKVAGVEAGASASVGKKGVSTGIGADAGSGTGSSSGGRDGTSSAGASGGSATGSKSAATGGASTIRPSVVLPRILWPLKARRAKSERGKWGYPLQLPARFVAVPGTPPAVVRVCRQAIASAASPLGAVRVRAASAGPLQRDRRGALTAPLAVRIDYAGLGGIEVRQARIKCRLDASGRVIAVI